MKSLLAILASTFLVTASPVISDAQTEDRGFIVNVGDVMMRWSNDLLRSTPHCVMDDPAAIGDEVPARYSMAYFCNPNRETVIECLPTCSSDERPAAYPPIRAGDYLHQRVAALVA